MYASARQRSTPRGALALVLPLAIVAVAACEEDDDGTTPDTDYSLTFSGDETFQAPHGDQAIQIVVETEDGTEVASDAGIVSATDDPSFSFDFADVLEADETYVVRYWIDSNFGDGMEGTCDEPSDDHQWSFDSGDDAGLATVSADLTLEDTHRPGELEDVCDSF